MQQIGFWQRVFSSGLLVLGLLAGAGAAADPVPVTVGAYVANIEEVNFKEGRLTIDFYVWFRWKDDARLESYKPLESMELMNGKIDGRGSTVEKVENGERYASQRITATIYQTWDIARFPFDAHVINVRLEDSRFDEHQLVFEPDTSNSHLGDELNLAGWEFPRFDIWAKSKVYRTSYGELQRRYSQSAYSRVSLLIEMRRQGYGLAVKVLTTVLIAALVAFVAFAIKPSNVDPRFGLGVGSLFAVAASALIVSGIVPDSAVLTMADQIHMLAMWLIFASLVQSAVCLKLEESGRERLYRRLDAASLVIYPLVLIAGSVWIARKAFI